MSSTKLPREFYTRSNVVTIARDLLGKLLVVPSASGRRISGIIVETEAYRGPHDRAAHSYGGRRTKRTETMFGMGGTAYVFFVYGMYNQFNVVTNVPDMPHAVLIRALEPVEGIETMRRRRHGQPDHNLTNGPGKLCIALASIANSTPPICWAVRSGWRKVRRLRVRASPPARALALITLKSGSTSRGASGSKTTHSSADGKYSFHKSRLMICSP